MQSGEKMTVAVAAATLALGALCAVALSSPNQGAGAKSATVAAVAR